MPEATFGECLAEARRKRGETIEEVSEQLRIRPSIILAMETNNFSHMPHKGYTRNMVSSYARYVGLDSTRITEQFLRESRNWERSGSKGTQYLDNASNYSVSTKRSRDTDDPYAPYSPNQKERELVSAAKRNTGASSLWNRQNEHGLDKEFRNQLRERQDDRTNRQRMEGRKTTTHRPSKDSKQISHNDYRGKPPRSGGAGTHTQVLSKPVLLVVVLIVIFLAILVLWAVLASNCARNDTSNVPVTGASQSDSGIESGQVGGNVPDIEEQIADGNRYGAFELQIDVADGASWMLVTIDGVEALNAVCNPPWSQTWTVMSSVELQFGAPGFVKVYRNGIEVPIELENGLGVVTLKVEVRPIVTSAQNADANAQS